MYEVLFMTNGVVSSVFVQFVRIYMYIRIFICLYVATHIRFSY